MLYDFKCEPCNRVRERYVPLKEFDIKQHCPQCQGEMKRLVSSGGIQTDDAPWIGSTTEFLKDGEEETVYNNPISSRKEYKRLLKEKGLEPVG